MHLKKLCPGFVIFVKNKQVNMGKIIITINRESGSGGRKIAFRLGELLGIKVYDKAAIEGLKTYKQEDYITGGILCPDSENARPGRQ